MILSHHGGVILLQLLAVSVVVKSHVCFLKKRPDPSFGGTLRWSLLSKELCYCQRVLAAPRFVSPDTCPIKDQACIDDFACNFWFVDNPMPLTQRQNWNKDSLDMLLERAVYCKEAIKAETEGASLSQKTDAVVASTSAAQAKTTQAETEGTRSSPKTTAVEASTSADQEETTQAKTEGLTSSPTTAAAEASTSANQEETTQAEIEGTSSSPKTNAVEASTSSDQEETTQAKTEGSTSSQKTAAAESSTSANQEETTQAPTEVIVTSTVEPECEPRPLGMADRTILDASITASSNQLGREPNHARLGGAHYWISAPSGNSDPWIGPWIQVDLGSSHRVTGLQTEGHEGSGYWVEQVNVKVAMSEASLKFIEGDNGQPKVFDANTDADNVVDIILDESGIRTRFVRIYPTLCKVNGNPWYSCLMRFEILGCQEN